MPSIRKDDLIRYGFSCLVFELPFEESAARYVDAAAATRLDGRVDARRRCAFRIRYASEMHRERAVH